MEKKTMDVAQTLAAIAQRRPVLGPLLQVGGEVLKLREEVVSRLSGGLTDVPRPDQARLAAGVPLLADASLEWARPGLEVAASVVLPGMIAFEPIAPEVAAFGQALQEGRLDLVKLAETFVAQQTAALGATGEAVDVSQGVMLFLMGQIVGPVLAVVSDQVFGTSPASWTAGNCPVCGAWPSVSYLARKSAEDNELSQYLRSGGGQKFLHCSLCGHEWHFRRGACPACGKDEPGTIQFLSDDRSRAERIDTCQHCKTYCPCIDLREFSETPDMDAATLEFLPLEIRAREEGFSPLAQGFWNTLG